MNKIKEYYPTKVTRREALFSLFSFVAPFAAASGLASFAEENRLAKFRNVQAVANDIIQAIEKRLETVPAGQTLFVPVGENHTRPSNRLALQALLQGLKRRGHAIAFGFEVDYDSLAEMKISESSEVQKASLLAGDPDGEHVLKMLSNKEELFLASPASFHNLFRFCLDEKISTSLNDLAKIHGILDGGTPIDPNDPLTAFFSRQLLLDPNVVLDAVEPAGMAMRNAAMVFNGIADAREEGARIYIQHCGLSHVLGDTLSENPFALSLTNNYLLSGADVLPVLLTTDMVGFDQNASDYMRRSQTVIIDDLDDTVFIASWLNPGPDGDAYAEELAYMRFLTRGTDVKLYDNKTEQFREAPEMTALRP